MKKTLIAGFVLFIFFLSISLISFNVNGAFNPFQDFALHAAIVQGNCNKTFNPDVCSARLPLIYLISFNSVFLMLLIFLVILCFILPLLLMFFHDNAGLFYFCSGFPFLCFYDFTAPMALMLCFWLAFILCLFEALNNRKFYFLALLFFVLAFFTHSQALMLFSFTLICFLFYASLKKVFVFPFIYFNWLTLNFSNLWQFLIKVVPFPYLWFYFKFNWRVPAVWFWNCLICCALIGAFLIDFRVLQVVELSLSACLPFVFDAFEPKFKKYFVFFMVVCLFFFASFYGLNVIKAV